MSNNSKLAFGKKNYIIMLVGIAVLIIGFFITASDKEEYGFGTLGLTVGPLTIMVGFIIEFFAIFYNSKEDKSKEK